MSKQRKEFRLPDEYVEIISRTKEEQSFATETEALMYILSEHKRQKDMSITDADIDKISELVIDKIQTRFKKDFTRIRLASTFAERYSYIVLDCINTMLYDSRSTFLMPASGETTHKVVLQSEENFKQILEKNKQIRDNENLKRGE